MKNYAVLVIEPNKNRYVAAFKELSEYRDLFYYLAWKDFKVRYKQTVIGFSWAIIRPLLTMIVFSTIFGGLANLPSDGQAPYPIMVFSAMLPWYFFATCLTESSQSVISNSGMISKIYFPRIIIPLSPFFVNFIDFLISIGILFGLMVWYQYMPGWQIIFIPFFLLLAAVTSAGADLILSALNVKYRDFRYVVPFIVQIGLYVSPVGFSSSVIPEKWSLLYNLNPMVGVIDGFRWSIMGGDAPLNLEALLISSVISTVLLLCGVVFFLRTERTFADII